MHTENSYISIEDAARPFDYQVCIAVEDGTLATLNGAYVNYWTWSGTEWTNYDCSAVTTESHESGIGQWTIDKCVQYVEDALDRHLRPYAVHYASAGCLPDSESPTFATIEECRDHIQNEWGIIADECDEWLDANGFPSDAYQEAIEAIENMQDDSKADDPRPGSLYAWSIESR